MPNKTTPSRLKPDAITLRQIRYFVEVATSDSLTAASRGLRVSQPAVGQQVKALEAALGVALFDRHSRGVRLSQAGISWLPSARRILAAVEEAALVAQEVSIPATANIRLGVTPSVARSLLPPLLFRSTQPGARLRFEFIEGVSEDLADLLSAGALDVAFGYQSSKSSGVKTLPFADEALCVVGPVPLIGADASPFPVDRLAELPLVLGRPPNAIRDLLEAALAARGRSVASVVELNLAGLKRDFLLGCDYSTVSPRGLFISDIRDGRLGGRPIEAAETVRRLYLLVRHSLSAETLGALLEALDVVLQEDVSRAELCWSHRDQEEAQRP